MIEKFELFGRYGTIATMPPKPISRDSMRLRRTQTLEAQRKQQIKNTAEMIYRNAVHAAENTEDSKYVYQLPVINRGQDDKSEFHRANMVEILDEVRSLFPDCSVEHTRMATAHDGKTYDVSKIDEKLKPFIMQHRIVECIVVDWS
jgi:hypothetical protein